MQRLQNLFHVSKAIQTNVTSHNTCRSEISFIVTVALIFLFLVPVPAFPDSDPIQVELNKVMPELPLPPNRPLLTTARHQIGADWTIANGYTGKGVSVVVMDWGTQANNIQLAGRIIQEVCTGYPNQTRKDMKCPNGTDSQEGVGAAEYPKNSDNTPMPASDHGTMVSSAVLEFAPDVRIISIRWNGDSSDSLKWIIANAKKYNIAAVNMSFGSPSLPRMGPCMSDYVGMETWKSEIQKLMDLGVATVVASGNEGMLSAISHPACLSNVVSVGAVGPTDKLVVYSNSSSELKLLAPTEFETAAVPQDPAKKDEWSSRFGGTSASSPVVAAMLAIGHSVAPNMTVNELVNAARATSTSVDDLVIKDLRRVNFDKFVQRLLNLKVQGMIESLTLSATTENSSTLKWVIKNAPTQVRVSLPGQLPESFPGTSGETVITRTGDTKEILAKVETVESDGSISSTKELLVVFPISNVSSWCNPTGSSLGTKATYFSGLLVNGVNKTNPELVDLVLQTNLAQASACIYIEFSPLDAPTIAYVGRLATSQSDYNFQFSIPRTFGTGGTLRVAKIDLKGNYSGIFSYYFPKDTFRTDPINITWGSAINSTDLQPDLLGILQKSLLIDRAVSPDMQALGNLKDAIAKIDANAAKSKAEFDAEIALQREAALNLQKQLDELKSTMSKKTTITCVRGKVVQKVSGVIPSCPSGFILKK